MLARVVTLRFDPMLEMFDDGPLRELVKDKEIVALREYFFVRNEVPYLAVVVSYVLRPPAPTSTGVGHSRSAGWRDVLSDADAPLFNALRDWRAERAKRDGVPPYVVLTNRQLAAMVSQMPRSLSALGAIEGIGKAKMEKYGEELLGMLARPGSRSVRSPRQSEDVGDADAPGPLFSSSGTKKES